MTSPTAGFAPAKVNLCLHVTGQRSDGYHLLDSLVAFADVGDLITMTPASQLSLTVTGPRAAGVPTDAENLVLRAAQLAGVTGQITLDKQLPAAGGIGGGSSDAAAMLRLVGSGVDPLPLGADLPVCLIARGARMSGIGEKVTPVYLPALPALLVNPGIGVATPQVFAALSEKSNTDLGNVPTFSSAEDVIMWLAQQRNDLERPATSLVPQINSVLQAIAGAGAALARMSGSGATCFGLFEKFADAQAAADLISTQHDDWWVQPCMLS
jgi:4-diphosphocytidyl-2-C-methyl-D-erythritol kinase